jgi:transcriptional regulator with XRE-family HTH domain
MWRDSLLIEFGKRVREERLRKGLTQEKLGRIAGMHRTYIGAVERGEKNLTLTNLQEIAKALKVKTVKLLEDL